MLNDPRKAKTLGEACDNGDGTYNGANALAWLSDVLTGGKGIAPEEVRRIFDAAKAKQHANNNSHAPMASTR